ncbi:MAG: SpoVR family protein, partial [Firmicutes bacterium]|nr:SpoVR family protein [Bacillota bacterium]
MAKAREFGLDFFDINFEICPADILYTFGAYGMPTRFSHWTFGKAYHKMKTQYDYNLGRIYEMVINSNPALAYLMRDNSLCLQILTIAHVYGHNDFFKNNFTFQSTRADLTLNLFKIHADRVRRYIEDPSIGIDRVEPLLDAAHALSLQCRRNLAVKKLPSHEERRRVLEAAQPPPDPFQRIHKRQDYT